MAKVGPGVPKSWENARTTVNSLPSHPHERSKVKGVGLKP